MAYDQHVAYQAPQRNYYDPHQQRPSQQQYHGLNEAYEDGHAGQYDQGYGPEYGQGYAQDYGYAQGPGQGHRGPPQQNPGQPPRGPVQRREPPRMMSGPGRGYDPRQQADPRQVYQQPQFAHSLPQHHNYGPQSPALQSTHSLDLPRNGGPPRQKQRPPPLDRSGSDNSFARRPLIEPVSPTDLPQDNAFPVFPTAKNKPSMQTIKTSDSGPPAAARGALRSNANHNAPMSPALQSHPSGPLSSSQQGRPGGPSQHNSYDSEPSHWGRAPNAHDLPFPKTQGFSGSRRPMDMPIRPGTAQDHRVMPPMDHQTHPSGHGRNYSQSDIYAEYYSEDLHPPTQTLTQPRPMAREEQIEREMPDFDNVGGRQQLSRTADDHVSGATQRQPPTMPQHPPQPPNGYHQQNGYHPQNNGRGPPVAARTPGPGMGPHPANQPPQPYQNSYASRDPYMNSQQVMGNQPSGFGPRQMPQRPGTADVYGRPLADYGQPGRAPSAPPMQGYGSSPMNPQLRQSPRMMSPAMNQRAPQANPDSLPSHPVPVRPGLMASRSSTEQSMVSQSSQRSGVGTPGQPLRANTGGTINSPPRPSPAAPRRTSVEKTGPVTLQEINHLQSMVNAHPQDFALALTLAKKLVEASVVLASDNGRLDARATTKNREKYVLDAHRRVKKLVSAGHPDAMFYLADCYGQGLLGLEEDPKEAFNLYQQAAKLGHPNAAYRTAVCCEIGPEEGGGTRRDIAKAVQWYRRAAQLQDVNAMFKVGMICLKGLLSQQKNIPEAERWLKRAAERADKENPHALHELGLLYEPDNADREVRAKIVADEKHARELFFQAAELGLKNSQTRLGQAFEYGSLGLQVDARQSIAWYSKAAAQGEHLAELALSGWYLTGAEGILENSDQEAYLWARKAASSDPPLAKAMFAMGYYTETGIGCPANLDEAKRWYGRAASYKFSKAIDRLEEIRKNGGKLPKDQKPGNRLQRKDMKGALR